MGIVTMGTTTWSVPGMEAIVAHRPTRAAPRRSLSRASVLIPTPARTTPQTAQAAVSPIVQAKNVARMVAVVVVDPVSSVRPVLLRANARQGPAVRPIARARIVGPMVAAVPVAPVGRASNAKMVSAPMRAVVCQTVRKRNAATTAVEAAAGIADCKRSAERTLHARTV